MLEEILAAPAGFKSIQLQWISLAMIQVALQSQTDKERIVIRKRVYQSAFDFVDERLRKVDALFRCRGGFLVVYGDLDNLDSPAHGAAISHDLNLHFVGTRKVDGFRVDSCSRTTTTSELAALAGQAKARSAHLDDARRPSRAPPPASTDWRHNPLGKLQGGKGHIIAEQAMQGRAQDAKRVGGTTQLHDALGRRLDLVSTVEEIGEDKPVVDKTGPAATVTQFDTRRAGLYPVWEELPD